MNKSIKTIIKILITVLMAISILLILPKTEKANIDVQDVTIKGRNGIECKLNDMIGTNKSIEIDSESVFNNKSLFCFERGQRLGWWNTDGQYYCTMVQSYTFEVTNDEVKRTRNNNAFSDEYKEANKGKWSENDVVYASKYTSNNACDLDNKDKYRAHIIRFAKGLIYILSNSTSDTYENDVQLALWAYINYNGDESTHGEVKDFFGIKNQMNDITINYKKDGHGNLISGGTITSAVKTSSNAYEIWLKAYKIYSNQISSNVEGLIYKLEENKINKDVNGKVIQGQEIIAVKKAKVSEIPPVKISFKKEDFNKKALSNVQIKIEKGDNVERIDKTSLTSGKDGGFGTITAYPIKNTGEIKFKIIETGTPLGYKKINEVTLTVGYDKSTGNVTKITSSDSTCVPTINNSNTVIIKNKPQIEKLTLLKQEPIYNANLEGATFKITLTNVESIGKYSVGGTKSGKIILTGIKTGKDGKLIIEDLVIADENKEVVITIEETAVPKTDGTFEYRQINGKIRIKLKRNGNGYEYYKIENDSTVEGKECNKDYLSLNEAKHEVELTVKNIPIITLSGKVWLDGQIGTKNVKEPNGLIDDEEKGIGGVVVELYSVRDQKVIASVHTRGGEGQDSGKYVFNDVEKTNEGYVIRFYYDGINYQTTKQYVKNVTTDEERNSKAMETYRKSFNDKFKTISKGESNNINRGKSNGVDPLGYKYDKDKKISTFQVTIDGTYPLDGSYPTDSAPFRMEAETVPYNRITSNINCGLVKKEFDLALGTDVKSARLEINEKSVKYNYTQIMNGEMSDLELDEILQGKSSDKNVNYNLYLYQSDYNYRISDYKTDVEGAIENTVNSSDNERDDYENLKELEAYVTYSVILKGQTTQNSTVNQFVYYYDEIYIPNNIVSTDEYDVVIDEEQRKITFTSKNDGFKISSPDYRVEVDLEFKVNKNKERYVELKENCTNIAEITAYSTDEGGLIDKDSAPGNGIANNKITQYEDDTDESEGLNISIRGEDSRTITGTVYEDTDKDGVLNNEDKAVNDVIVQLIEIKKIGGKYYEYIWQETKSGSNIVRTTARNGYSGESYNNSVKTDGQYEFKEFIPGNYIIRYIYGDGTTYDLTDNVKKDNVKKYNGQDYKSTKDLNYNKTWYNTAGYTIGQSVARDNEARRLEVMKYSSTIDKTNGEALERRNEEDLKNTWMAAETSRINVPIDVENKEERLNTEEQNIIIPYIDTKTDIIAFEGVHFGLELRPQTKLVLEKHITGLKITPNGTGVQSIVDAQASIEKILEGDTVETKGVTQGLATIKSTRGNRGFWQVATDIEELAQGAQLEVEYTYVIKNEGDQDYLSKTLIDAYEAQDTKPYNDSLNEIINTVKGTMKNGAYSYKNNNTIGQYLGQYYYNGQVAATDAEVSSRIEKLEEALNNDLTFNSETSGKDFTKTNNDKIQKLVYDTNGTEALKDIETVIESSKASSFLTPKSGDKYTQGTDVDYSKKVTLRTTLSSTTGGELGANIPSYIAEVVKYSNAAGRRDMESKPENLSYVHSDDTEMTMENSNERDEFWGERIIITKPTGEDKFSPMQIAIITVSSIAVLGVGIFSIKKFVLKK